MAILKREEKKHSLADKMSNLRSTIANVSTNSNSSADNLMHNLSLKSFTATQLEVISRGANFNTANANVINFIASLEVALT